VSDIGFDWIAPGEIRFCSCGYTLLRPGDAVCANCRWYKGDCTLEDLEAGMAEHSRLLRGAIDLSKQRQEIGVPRLFWMKGAL